MTLAAESKPNNILFVNYHGTIGGGQIHLLNILAELDRKKFNPQVVCCQEGVFVDKLNELGIATKLIFFGKAKFRYWIVALKAIWKFYKILKEQKIKLVHVSGLEEAKLAAYACHLAKVPMVWVVAP